MTKTEWHFVTFRLNPHWPEIDWEWLVVPRRAANEDRY
jgi:hypothetical protein